LKSDIQDEYVISIFVFFITPILFIISKYVIDYVIDILITG